LGLVLGFFGNVYIDGLSAAPASCVRAWLPGYLEQQRHVSIAKTGFVASVPFLFGLVGGIVGGYVADRLTTRGMTAIAGREALTVIGLVIMACATFSAAETDSNFIAVASISAAIFFGQSSSGTSWSPATACAPPNYTASLGAMVTGFMVQAKGSFTPALLVAGVIGLCSAVAYGVLIRSEPIAIKSLAAGLA
jgi:hypothetical protein